MITMGNVQNLPDILSLSHGRFLRGHHRPYSELAAFASDMRWHGGEQVQACGRFLERAPVHEATHEADPLLDILRGNRAPLVSRSISGGATI